MKSFPSLLWETVGRKWKRRCHLLTSVCYFSPWSLSTEQWFDYTFRYEEASCASWLGTDVNTSEHMAGISLDKTRVCCKLKNAVKLRFYSASLYCPVSKWHLRWHKFVAANCNRPGVSRKTFLILLFSRWCYVLQVLDMCGSCLEWLKVVNNESYLIYSEGKIGISWTSMCDHLPWGTTYPKHQNPPSLSLTVGISPVSARDHLLGWRFNDFALLLTSCKRPLDEFSDLLW